MKKVIIIHGQFGTPENCWFPWLKQELESRGFLVQIPSMPNPSNPKIEEWIPFMDANFLVDRDTYFVGHSVGCQAILRFLEKFGGSIGGVVLVGGWLTASLGNKDDVSREIIRPWLQTPIDFRQVKERTKKIVAVLSDNDPYTPLVNIELYKRKLNARVVVELGMGHFDEEDMITELPVVLEELLLMKAQEK